LDVGKPRSIGPFGAQNVYTEVKQQQESAIIAVEDVLEEIWMDFNDLFRRQYSSVETYMTADAEVVLVTMGAIGETARTAVDEMRADGFAVGLARIRMWRPFPCKQLVTILQDATTIAVVDRILSPGAAGGPMATEIRSLFYRHVEPPQIFNFIAGLGGREISRRTFREIVKRTQNEDSQTRDYTLIDVRSS
jgi:pyruvate ferredoxin oxidoreductase alpha subunit